MTHPTYDEFAAGDSMLGYIYQAEYALYLLLDRDRPTDQISIETLDDLATGDISDPQALLQLKLRRIAEGQPIRRLTDRSEDLWKTIRLWATRVQSKQIDPTRTKLLLLTTSPPSANGGIANLLCPAENIDGNKRDEATAIREMVAVAEQIVAEATTNSPLSKGASALLGLDLGDRLDLIRNIVIVTNAPCITSLRTKIEARLRASGCTFESRTQFVEMVVGWWYRQVVQCLQDKRAIPFDSLEMRLTEAAKTFALPNLPRYQALEQPSEVELEEIVGWIFVQQLIALGLVQENSLVKAALVDFYKAAGHRKKWLDDFRLERRDLVVFEDDLKGLWATNFGVAEAEVERCLREQDVEGELQRLGRNVLQATLNSSAPKLRGFAGDYLARGSFHMLANTPSIGWHPRWQAMFGDSG